LLVVIIIVGILSTIAVNTFFASTERARDREAQANLKLISAAEKIYRLENSGYIKLDTATEINQVLRLTLPVDGKYWTYSVAVSGADNSEFDASAQRVWNKPAKTCTMDETDEEPECS
jgi:type II secretory pathway pseudopilin PulG